MSEKKKNESAEEIKQTVDEGVEEPTRTVGEGAEEITRIVVEGAEEIKRTEDVIYFKATRLITVEEHAALREKIAIEEKATGIKIVLIPYVCVLADEGQK